MAPRRDLYPSRMNTSDNPPHGLVTRTPVRSTADGDRYAIAHVDVVRHSVVLGVPIFADLRIDL